MSDAHVDEALEELQHGLGFIDLKQTYIFICQHCFYELGVSGACNIFQIIPKLTPNRTNIFTTQKNSPKETFTATQTQKNPPKITFTAAPKQSKFTRNSTQKHYKTTQTKHPLHENKHATIPRRAGMANRAEQP
jgi:hypothetical protein